MGKNSPPSHTPFRTAPLARAISLTLALSGGLALTGPAYAQAINDPAPTSTSLKQFAIAAGPLSEVLNQFASSAGVALSFDAAQFRGKQSHGLKGMYSVAQGFAELLAGTGYSAKRQGNGDFVLEKSHAQTLPAIKISSSAIQDGSVEVGYVSKEVSQVGPWQGRELQDIPYSVNVISEDLIENVQSFNTDEIIKINPVTQFYYPQAQNEQTSVYMRGFQNSAIARNGITRQQWNYAFGTATEEIAQVETLTGLSGFLYGGANVGGIMNFMTKRPTDERYNSVTAANTGGENYYAHGDFGGQFDTDGTFGYRINLAAQDGDTAVNHMDTERQFVSGLFDWQVTDDLVLELDLSKSNYHLDGRNAFWYIGTGATRPDADDLDTDTTWGQRWTLNKTEAQRIGINLKWNISEHMRLRSGFLDEETKRTRHSAFNTIQSNGTYDQRIDNRENAPDTLNGEGYFGFWDIDFATGGIEHTLTLGYQYSDSYWDIYSAGRVQNTYTGYSLSSPAYIPEPDWGIIDSGSQYKGYHQQTNNLTVGDDIRFNDKWSALVGLNNTSIIYENWNASGAKTSDYDKDDTTPTVSLLYKPMANITTYTSYMEGLEQGGVAGTFGAYNVINENEVMAPLISEQFELGVKANINEMLLTAALFEIDKPLEYYKLLNSTEAEYVQDGRQVHRGLELTATGKLTHRLTLVGGATWLDAKIKDNEQSPDLEGNRPIDVAEHFFKMYAEYKTPWVQGLILTGGAFYTGDRYGDAENTDDLGSYTLLDIGARYTFSAANNPITVRFKINNLTDKHYWANRFYLGEPRSFVISGQVEF